MKNSVYLLLVIQYVCILASCGKFDKPTDDTINEVVFYFTTFQCCNTIKVIMNEDIVVYV